MRILICNWKDISHSRAGGAEVYTHEIARHWVVAGHRVTLLCAEVEGRPPTECVDGVSVVRRGKRFGVYKEAGRFYRESGRNAFDLIVDEVNTRPFFASEWADGTPVVALFHQVCREIWWYETPLPIALLGRHVFEPHWLSRYRSIPTLTVSESSRSWLLAAGLEDVHVVPVGIHMRPRLQVDRATLPTLIYLGRFSRSKRPGHAIEALRILRRSIPEAQLWMIGEGPMRSKLARKQPPGTHFFGRVPDNQRDALLARAHALVITSVREGWGLVVDEAAAMGTPVIGYDRPGLCDSIPAAGGILVDPHPRALAMSLVEHLPAFFSRPSKQGWRGGAVDWETVAANFLATALSIQGVT